MKRSRKLTNIIFLIEMWSKLYRRIISEDKTTLGHGSYTDYQPVLEDWLWHTVFPLVSYTALLVAAIVLACPGSSNGAGPVPPSFSPCACASSSHPQSDTLSRRVAWDDRAALLALDAAAPVLLRPQAASFLESASATALLPLLLPTALPRDPDSVLPDSAHPQSDAPVLAGFALPHRASAPAVRSRSTDIEASREACGTVGQSGASGRPNRHRVLAWDNSVASMLVAHDRPVRAHQD